MRLDIIFEQAWSYYAGTLRIGDLGMKNMTADQLYGFDDVESDHLRKKILSGLKSFRSSWSENPKIFCRKKIWAEWKIMGKLKLKC